MNKNIIDNNNIISQIFLYLYIINLIKMKYKIISQNKVKRIIKKIIEGNFHI